MKCIDDEVPFEIPQGWEWCRMQDVITFVNGRAYKKEELLSRGKYKVLRVGNFFTNNQWYYSDLELSEDKYCYHGDLLYAWSASFGPQIWNGDKTIFHYHIWNVKFDTKVLFREYLYYFFLFDKTQVRASTTGSTMVHVSMENMKPRLIPIPPIDEQKRIVCGVERVLPYVEKYELSQSRKDILDANIKESLKKSILQEAIQGKLVPQIDSEGTAQELLEQIKAEKQKLVKEGKLKKSALNDSVIFRGDDNKYYEQVGSEVSEIELPFDFPSSWSIARLNAVCQLTDGLKTTGKLCLLDAKYLRGKSSETIVEQGKLVCKGDNIILVDGENSGEVFNVPQDGYMGSTFKQLWINSSMYKPYVLAFIQFYKETLRNSKKGAAIPHLNKELFYGLIIGIPPLQEQRRIVHKIEESAQVLK
ncbi:restriction endonuclease subunit S [Hoylesella buccalis]|uniref:restriction endonuclease subunit S n=1 Tax=Hoylesella buccalis TaxID=28127 RepID=UPI002889ED0B|nr:restriction endonuclease subunit S [Hoylesella buccalis]